MRARVRTRGGGFESATLEAGVLLLGRSAAPDHGDEALQRFGEDTVVSGEQARGMSVP